MKKLTAVLLIVFLLLSAACAETVDESFYVGTWVNFAYLRNGGCVVTLFHLDEDHTSYFLIRSFSGPSGSSGRENICTWSASGNDLTVVTGNTSLELFVTSDYRLASRITGGYEIYEKVGGSAPVPGSGGNLRDGLVIHPGQYIVGVDLPAGDYRFELYEKSSDIYVRKTPDAVMFSTYAGLTKSSPVYAKLSLPEGARVDIGPYPVIIMYAKPLNLGE